MQFVGFTFTLMVSYLIGSLPMGLYIVKLVSGKDIRLIQSGRTGGTNAMRAAGFWAGFATATLDILKGIGSVWIAQAVIPGNHWITILAPIAAIIGHNYSIFLIEKNNNGKIRLRGGAGGAPATGGATGLWPPTLLFIIPVGAFFLFGVGYASLTTLSIPLVTIIVFSIRASLGLSPWIYVLYGVFAEIILIWALRPNIKRLLNGKERLVGWRAKQAKSKKDKMPNKTVGFDSNNA
jgi:glycerol-3-phosphate acyltransferase PlsY